MLSHGRYSKQLMGRGCYGVVEVNLELNCVITSITVQVHGKGFSSQGYIEDVPEQGYEDWKQGAMLGVAFALWKAGRTGCSVIVTRIEGLTSDTNPTIIAAAAMDAVWKALAFIPEPALTKQIE